MLKEICKALLEADVNIKLVKRLQENVKCVYVQRVQQCTYMNTTLNEHTDYKRECRGQL